jgi:gamma-glutamyltranspeptidase/glutathione hydrolase
MKGVVAAGHELTARAGVEMLKEGGNAFDAALAAAFTSFVCEPALTSPGAGGFFMAHTKEGKTILYDFFPNMPGINRDLEKGEKHFYSGVVKFAGTVQEFHIGEGAAAVPGCIAGLDMVYKRHCSLPLMDIMTPAISYARDGITLSAYQAYFQNLLSYILTASGEARSIYAPKGSLLKEGETIFNRGMADTLEHLAKEGLGMFYKGDLADRILEGFEEHGLITRKDLEEYRVETREPLVFEYRNRKIFTNPPPSSGGCLIAFSLKLLEAYNLYRLGHNKPPYLKLLSEAMRVTNEARGEDFDHRVYEEDITRNFLSDKNIAFYRDRIEAVASNYEGRKERGTGSTTHISVIDKEGNAASITTSSGAGCGFMIPGTGIMMNNMLGEEDLNPHGYHTHEPGTRISSMMAPTIVMKRDKPEIVLGSGGSKRIRSAILQVILNIVDHGLPVFDAVNAPRVHCDNDLLHVEGGVEESTINRLKKDDIRILEWSDRDMYFGGVHTVFWDDSNNLISGGGDIRRGGVSKHT